MLPVRFSVHIHNARALDARVLPPCEPQQYVGEDKEEKTDECRQKVKKIEVADREMDADGAAESRTAHHGHDFDKAAVQLRKARHEKEQAADGA